MPVPQTQVLAQASAGSPAPPYCRFCDERLERTFVDLGMSPVCERFVPLDRLDEMETFFPLHVRICDACDLVQLPAYVPREELFTEYAYFSSYSSSWVEHARRYVAMMRSRLALGPSDFVVEIASNDGYLLQHLVGSGIPMLGIDPAANVAAAAKERGVPTLVAFFGRETAERLADDGRRASLVVANNVLAHVPDLNDFVAGVATVLRPNGTATFEFPHLLRLMEGVQYDTIYHEHYSYFSFATAVRVLRAHGLEPYDVEELPTHGGSLRTYVQHAGGPHAVTGAAAAVLAAEGAAELHASQRHAAFAAAVEASKWALLDLLIGLRREGRHVVGYGAPGKANTLLNYCGIRTDLLDYTVDRNPYKHGLFTPGTHIPIHAPEMIWDTRPDYVLVLPWNLIDEISEQLTGVRRWGGKLIVPIPEAAVVDPGARRPGAAGGKTPRAGIDAGSPRSRG